MTTLNVHRSNVIAVNSFIEFKELMEEHFPTVRVELTMAGVVPDVSLVVLHQRGEEWPFRNDNDMLLMDFIGDYLREHQVCILTSLAVRANGEVVLHSHSVDSVNNRHIVTSAHVMALHQVIRTLS